MSWYVKADKEAPKIKEWQQCAAAQQEAATHLDAASESIAKYVAGASQNLSPISDELGNLGESTTDYLYRAADSLSKAKKAYTGAMESAIGSLRKSPMISELEAKKYKLTPGVKLSEVSSNVADTIMRDRWEMGEPILDNNLFDNWSMLIRSNSSILENIFENMSEDRRVYNTVFADQKDELLKRVAAFPDITKPTVTEYKKSRQDLPWYLTGFVPNGPCTLEEALKFLNNPAWDSPPSSRQSDVKGIGKEMATLLQSKVDAITKDSGSASGTQLVTTPKLDLSIYIDTERAKADPNSAFITFEYEVSQDSQYMGGVHADGIETARDNQRAQLATLQNYVDGWIPELKALITANMFSDEQFFSTIQKGNFMPHVNMSLTKVRDIIHKLDKAGLVTHVNPPRIENYTDEELGLHEIVPGEALSGTPPPEPFISDVKGTPGTEKITKFK